ncbi:hypothetical protein GGS23DRAFT_612884 [Durotheca rogersii]|uniref:uncharacterized protein n=1 Tax=Durotheca rogersii TaxID=419775 RepID=UPI00221FA0A1|nr:uncharacterized protein GGS23DRAFT_612884 [Durotheca rogersii]KAI5867724.1 hypothetical protein GGS23DRAFT_612884 [Durotheca rogersii]
MSGLRKKQSVSLAVSADNSPCKSPSSKSDQGGGVRLDAVLDGLSLDGSPSRSPTANIYEPLGARNGHGSPRFGGHRLRGAKSQNNIGFQVGKYDDDRNVFGISPNEVRGAYTQAPMTVGSTMQAAFPVCPARTPLRSRASELGIRSQVAGIDAQAFYPATACVFVANLPENVKDSRLEAEVTRAFSKFGIVFVKIRRDQRNMPFAFCQFTKDEDAHTAMAQGKGILIEGRPCRTEMVKANRSFVIYDIVGHGVDVEDARTRMSTYGPLSKCEELHPQLQQALGTPGGILFEFASFDPNRDVITAYKYHPQYRVVAYDLKKSAQPKPDADEIWLQRYEVDRRSVFIGNLPIDVPDIEDILKDVASGVGDVEKVHVIQKDAKGGHNNPIAFGFIEFSRPDLAELAVMQLNGMILEGSSVRVERKASRESQNNRGTPSRMILNDARSPEDYERHRVRNIPTGDKAAEPRTPVRGRTGEDSLPPTSASKSDGTAASGGRRDTAQAQTYHTYAPYGARPYASPTYVPPYDPHINTGGFPVTPQGTPGMLSPYGPNAFYSTPYSWMTPYLQDPNFSQVNFYHPYSHASEPRSVGDFSVTGALSTPTRGSTRQDKPRNGDDAHQEA